MYVSAMWLHTATNNTVLCLLFHTHTYAQLCQNGQWCRRVIALLDDRTSIMYLLKTTHTSFTELTVVCRIYDYQSTYIRVFRILSPKRSFHAKFRSKQMPLTLPPSGQFWSVMLSNGRRNMVEFFRSTRFIEVRSHRMRCVAFIIRSENSDDATGW